MSYRGVRFNVTAVARKRLARPFATTLSQVSTWREGTSAGERRREYNDQAAALAFFLPLDFESFLVSGFESEPPELSVGVSEPLSESALGPVEE